MRSNHGRQQDNPGVPDFRHDDVRSRGPLLSWVTELVELRGQVFLELVERAAEQAAEV